ncbi:hypothetical protein Cst_c18440 [Thermoclostridium stercorarium subsp. stercorarium DSM 8532]|uniref:Uncharacterized protein n=1 Tax=Thermoclostridium stercorarium (strain ATCC 35414 / DSM 8532 / NCIMB 11754) TaxID=1121335 RepID=L7VQZ5_THES1|nr:hypothetical protein Cst_c18440 [Thermoclostridium stercorarium subsp. stercorarium DSM 8532]
MTFSYNQFSMGTELRHRKLFYLNAILHNITAFKLIMPVLKA